MGLIWYTLLKVGMLQTIFKWKMHFPYDKPNFINKIILFIFHVFFHHFFAFVWLISYSISIRVCRLVTRNLTLHFSLDSGPSNATSRGRSGHA